MHNDTCPKCGAQRNAGPECGACGVIYARAEQRAYDEKRQQQRSQVPKETKTIQRMVNPSHYAIDCTACKLAEGMEKKTIPRFPLFIRLLGLIIATPSAVGMLLGFVIMFKPGGGFGLDSTGFFVGGGFVMLSAVGGLVGWLLLMRKKAFVCSRCGFMLDRA